MRFPVQYKPSKGAAGLVWRAPKGKRSSAAKGMRVGQGLGRSGGRGWSTCLPVSSAQVPKNGPQVQERRRLHVA